MINFDELRNLEGKIMQGIELCENADEGIVLSFSPTGEEIEVGFSGGEGFVKLTKLDQKTGSWISEEVNATRSRKKT